MKLGSEALLIKDFKSYDLIESEEETGAFHGIGISTIAIELDIFLEFFSISKVVSEMQALMMKYDLGLFFVLSNIEGPDGKFRK